MEHTITMVAPTLAAVPAAVVLVTKTITPLFLETAIRFVLAQLALAPHTLRVAIAQTAGAHIL